MPTCTWPMAFTAGAIFSAYSLSASSHLVRDHATCAIVVPQCPLKADAVSANDTITNKIVKPYTGYWPQ